MEDLDFWSRVFTVYFVVFISLVSMFPLHGMYSIGTSLEIQQLALFIVDGVDISDYMYWGTGVQFPAPAQAFIVAFFYMLTKNIDVACAISNIMFSLLTVFIFRRFSRSPRLSLLLVFIPFWFCLSFIATPDMPGILFILLSLFFYEREYYSLAIGLSAVSGLFRIENFGVSLIMLLHSRRWKYLPFLAVSGGAFLAWYQFVFGDMFIMLREHLKVSIQLDYVVNSIIESWNSGFYGVGKVLYTTLLLMISIATVIFARKRFGNGIYFLLSSYLLLVHTIVFPVGVYFEYVRFFLQLAPISLIVFRNEVEKWFVPICTVIMIVSFGTTYMFYSKAIWGVVI